MPTLTVRPARRRDVQALAALERRVFVRTYGAHLDAHTVETHLDATLSEPIAGRYLGPPWVTTLVAVVDERVVGLARLLVSPLPACVRELASLELATLYVDPDHQGAGVGGHLLRAAVPVVHAMRCRGLWLKVWKDNHGAVDFYERNGFARVGTADVRVGDVVFEDHVMHRVLIGGD